MGGLGSHMVDLTASLSNSVTRVPEQQRHCSGTRHCCSAKHPEQDVCIQSVHERIEACKRVSAWSEHLLIGKRGSGEDWGTVPCVVASRFSHL